MDVRRIHFDAVLFITEEWNAYFSRNENTCCSLGMKEWNEPLPYPYHSIKIIDFFSRNYFQEKKSEMFFSKHFFRRNLFLNFFSRTYFPKVFLGKYVFGKVFKRKMFMSFWERFSEKNILGKCFSRKMFMGKCWAKCFQKNVSKKVLSGEKTFRGKFNREKCL